MSKQAKLWAEVQGRIVSLQVKAPPQKNLLLEPRLLVERFNPKLSMIARLPLQGTDIAPAGALGIAPDQSVTLAIWTGEIDHPTIDGPSALAVLQGDKEPGSGYERGQAPPGQYKITAFSFLDGDPILTTQINLPPGTDTATRPEDATDDGSFVRAFLSQAKLLPQEMCWIKAGRYEETELLEMACFADRRDIPPLHRELLTRLKRLKIADHDLVTPPIIEDDLEEVRLQSRERELFPWFSIKPYDHGDFICFDLEKGGLVRVRNLQVEALGESPRGYLLKLLHLAQER